MIASLTFWHGKTSAKTRETKAKTFVILFWRPEEFAGLQLQRLSLHQHNHGWARKHSLILAKKRKKKKKTSKQNIQLGIKAFDATYFFSNWFPVELATDQRWQVGDETHFSLHPPHRENKYPLTLAERKRKGNHGNAFFSLLFSPQSFTRLDLIQAARRCFDFDTKPFNIMGRKKDAVTANNAQEGARSMTGHGYHNSPGPCAYLKELAATIMTEGNAAGGTKASGNW